MLDPYDNFLKERTTIMYTARIKNSRGRTLLVLTAKGGLCKFSKVLNRWAALLLPGCRIEVYDDDGQSMGNWILATR